MKLQVLSIVSLVGFGAGCVGGTVGTSGANEASADVQVNTSLAKRRDHRPAKTPLDKLRRAATTFAARKGLPVLPQAVASATQPNLVYNNGPMIQSVQIYAVLWGPNVNSSVVAGLPGFYSGITSSQSAIDTMLQQYNTNGMTIGNGTFMGTVNDDDAAIPASGTITDEMIEAEAARLVDTGKVPAEDGQNILMFYFPPGVSIDQGGGTLSCQVFCAYHSTFTRNGNNFYYGVIPDQNSGGCEQGCGLTTDPVKTTYSTSSHELIEAITDGAVGVNDLAWYDQNFGEIGDICIEWDGMSNNYYVQSEWSNADKGCVDHTATTHAAVDVQYDDTATTAPGGTATFNLTSSGTATGALTLETADLFTGSGGFTPTWSPATVNVGGSSTLSVAVPTGLRSQDATFKVGASDTNGAHHFAQVTLHVKGASPTITSATPATGPTQGGNVVNIVGTNFGVGATAKICANTSTTCPANSASTVPAMGQYVSGTNGTQFQLIMPSYNIGTSASKQVKIWITNLNDTTAAKIAYTYTTGTAPTVAGVVPAQGPTAGGTFVTITGTNFSSNSVVTFGGTPLDCNSDQNQNCAIEDDKTIIAITPAGSGMAAVTVTNADKLAGTMMNAFNYGPNAPPSIDSLSVDTGPTAGGTYVTVYVENVDQSATVTFDGIAAPIKTYNPGFVGVFSPPHAAGAVDLVVTNSDMQSTKTTFTYSDSVGGGGDGGVGDGGIGDGGTDDGGDNGGGNGGGDGTGGGGSGGSNGISGNNHINPSSGCSFGDDGSSAPSILAVLAVLGALGFALRRQRS